jgi:protein-S-isoprenylcysteine O-methyltransferase Ste14
MIQRFRVPLGFLIAALVLYLAQPTSFSLLLGLPIAIAGAVLRGLAAGVIRKDAVLTTSGPYAWTRNPLYLGSFLLGVGFGVMSGSWIAAAVIVLPSFFIYPHVIRREEEHLARLFPGAFAEYCSRVPRFIPTLRKSSFSFSYRQYISNREYNTTIGLVLAVLILILKSR